MPSKRIILKRILISLLIGLLAGAAISEIPFLFLRETARSPREIVLVIPKGASKQVARGEQPPSIPENMTFVVGDTLVVKNEDDADHKLGPLWIPAHASAQLSLDRKENIAFECSFQPDNSMGLDIYEPVTLSTRLAGIFSTGISMAIFIALYSLAIPVKKKENAPA